MFDSDKINESMGIIKQNMIDDNPSEPGSYAHAWHCNIAMSFYDVLPDTILKFAEDNNIDLHDIANKGASKFMKLCFDVDTK